MLAYLKRLIVDRRPVAAFIVLCLSVLAAASGYTVRAGDTLSQIASSNGVTTAALASANGISDPNKIWVGQVLQVPTSSANSSAAAVVYVVQPGESLGEIARKFKTTVSAISTLNGITNPNVVYAGTRLRVSGEPVVAAPSPTATSSATHTVKAGESLSQIAAKYSMKSSDLASTNAITNPDRIYVGQVLKVSGTGGFVCPVPGATFFNDWGFPRSDSRYHEGNDLFAPRGTPVLAPVSGFVHQIEGTIGGIQFRLEGDNGNRYIGTHMDSFGKSGQVVAGEVIGYVGDSGNAKGSNPHLHFEIALNRTETVNPYPYLVPACKG
ncbi:MAG: M23 family metallopeptidase [Acidimicrobiia bacterium]|nr:M23 family metallopeptidase [Acidimicrobiia bacterium]